MSTVMQIAPTAGKGRRVLSEAQWRSLAAALKLSQREFEVVQYIFDGKKEPVVARELGISRHTVRTHVKRIYRKLAVHDRSELLVRIFAAYASLAPGGRTVRRPPSSKRTMRRRRALTPD